MTGFLIGLKGTMGEAKLHFLHVRMIGGKENAASKGELRFPLPVGYIYGFDGKTIMDPDEEVQHAVSPCPRHAVLPKAPTVSSSIS